MQRGMKWLMVCVASFGFLVVLAAGHCSGGQSGEKTLTVATGVDINAANNVRPTGTSHALPPTHASASPQARAPRPGVAPSAGALPFKAEPNLASALAEHASKRKSSRGLEAELIAADLITLAPPETAIPLLKEKTPEKRVEPVGGRKPLLTWPPQEPYKEPARTDSKPRPEIPIRKLTT